MIGFVKKIFGINKVETIQNISETKTTNITSIEQVEKVEQEPPGNLKKGACDCGMCGCLCGSEDCTCCC